MRRIILGIVLAISLALAGGFPDDPRFDQPVTLKTSAAGDPLEVVLSALARSVGLTPVIKLPAELHKVRVRLVVNQKPFRELWSIIIQAYGEGKLDYAILDDGILLVAPPEVVARAAGKAPEPKAEKPAIRREFLAVRYLDPDKTAELLKKEIPGLSVVRVPNQRLLIVRGTPERIEEAKQLLKRIDVAPPPVKNQTKEPVLRRFYVVRYVNPEKVVDFLAREVPGVKITPVPGQRVLVVRGTEKQQEEVQRILEKIDVPPEAGPPIYQRTFKLSNARAKDLAKVLSEALKAKGLSSTTAAGNQEGAAQGPANPGSSTVSIVADERTNTLIVTGTAEQLALVEELIPKLDKPVEQVNVQVRIQEVTRSTLNSLGLNWETAGGNLVAALAETGLRLIFDSTRSLAALNINATLNALEKQGLSRRVNDSNITVLNNQTGKIQSGFTFFIRKVVEGKVEKVPYDAGVIVQVTPQVTNSGEIVLKVHTEVSDILERNPVDGDVDKLSKQVSETILRVKDGQTVVIGGLIKSSMKHSKQGIPLLSDIPVLGALFSQTSDEQEDNELIIVLKARRITPTECPAPLKVPCH